MNDSHKSSRSWQNRIFRSLAILAVLVVLLLLIATQVIRVIYLADPSRGLPAGPDRDAQIILDRAEDAVAAVELVLSFLEGASVLIGLGFGAATLYGLRSTQETRAELEKEIKRVEAIRVRLDEQLAELRDYRPQLADLANLRQTLNQSLDTLGITIKNVAELLQADQEFRLRNYDTAYAFAQKVLNEEPDNPIALYIAGWLEVQHLHDKLDEGIAHLAKVAAQETDWPTVKAAYGVGLRRKARTMQGEVREQLFWQA
ncbi:MAG: hypothetical protein JW910_03145, partial [Anaerolineae bacterium]|nr:hypothetical protein [Anaerolineae bacterium]